MDVNKVLISGYVATKPELTIKSNGSKICRFMLATDNSFFNSEHQKVENTLWHSVNIYGKKAETLHKMVKVGAKLLIDGKSAPYSYVKDDEKRWGHSLSSLNFIVLNWPKDKSNDGNQNLENDFNVPEDIQANLRDYDLTPETHFTVDEIPF